MKTKILLKFSVLAAIPALLSTMMVLIISFEWFMTGESRFAQLFLNGEFNITFTMSFFAAGFISILWIVMGLTSTVRHADNIDRLEEAIYECYKSKRQYEEATRKIVELQNSK